MSEFLTVYVIVAGFMSLIISTVRLYLDDKEKGIAGAVIFGSLLWPITLFAYLIRFFRWVKTPSFRTISNMLDDVKDMWQDDIFGKGRN